MKDLIDKLYNTGNLTDAELEALLLDDNENEYLRKRAEEKRISVYGREVYIRGLIEISNYCKNNCLYCGIRAGNEKAERYRLSTDDILSCCDMGYEAGFRTFVLQGGEDIKQDDDFIVTTVKAIKSKYPDCAVTLSVGEKSFESYKKYRDAGADRYLLRHETIEKCHYEKLHPKNMTLENRVRCLKDLKALGFQVGCGIMVGSPYQELKYIIKDLRFIKEFEPQMVGIGPFIPHHDTPFKDYPAGDLRLTLMAIAITRLLLPKALIPATTALATLSKEGVKKGILSGANVVMPNLSPAGIRAKYAIYDNKASREGQSAEGIEILSEELKSIGYHIDFSKGDF